MGLIHADNFNEWRIMSYYDVVAVTVDIIALRCAYV